MRLRRLDITCAALAAAADTATLSPSESRREAFCTAYRLAKPEGLVIVGNCQVARRLLANVRIPICAAVDAGRGLPALPCSTPPICGAVRPPKKKGGFTPKPPTRALVPICCHWKANLRMVDAIRCWPLYPLRWPLNLTPGRINDVCLGQGVALLARASVRGQMRVGAGRDGYMSKLARLRLGVASPVSWLPWAL